MGSQAYNHQSSLSYQPGVPLHGDVVVGKSPATQVPEPAAGQLIGAQVFTVQPESITLFGGYRPADCKK